MGAANVPGEWSRVDVSSPLAVVEVNDSMVSMRLRVFGRFGGAPRLAARFDELKRVYLVRRSGMVFGVGVAFTAADGSDFYFWGTHTWELVQLLRRAGVQISDAVEPATKLWRGGA
ncbi:hypothetical protein [Allobranchiibius sp. GilTou73]|uniref:hypothetical protein n=1 Tax=Allobranchiibius sp. GilTou73 TaxID=2904523 RepID=UPI001F4455F0|nr:hypothetical protein [Allobranchiibius sp. GilTou73]UIJ36002.1 hypothetical protein LVQ62_06400 [Allobranchiibius sp. GilTou73]